MAGLFSEATLERIRAASEIVEIIGAYVPLKRAGGAFVALCPFHKEKSPSFHVNPQRQIFHCFGCHKGGDVFSFVKDYENVDFPEAVRRLADRAKIPLEYDGEPPQARHIKEQLLSLHEQVTQRWQNALLNEAAGQPGRDYILKRGLTDEAVKLFRIGFAPEAWDDIVNWCGSKNITMELAEAAGLVVRKPESGRYYDRFRGRLMFPICDEQGRVIGFSGRILKPDEKAAKYVNSPETPIFTKSKVFFGLDKSRRALVDTGKAVICEGQLDLIACFMAGVQNIVAPQGTAFTGDHARILKRYVEEVVLCFDSDEAGQNAAVRSLDKLLGVGLAASVAIVPSPHDPDSYIREFGAAAFCELIHNAQGFFDYYLARLVSSNDLASDKGRLAVLHGMAEAVLKTNNSVLVDKYAQKTALRLGVAPDAVRGEFRKAGRRKPAPAAEPAGMADEEADALAREADTAEELPAPSVHETWLLRILLEHEALAPWAAVHLEPEWIAHPHVQEIVRARLKATREESWSSIPAFLDHFENPAVRALITQATSEARAVKSPGVQLADLALKMRNAFLDKQLAALTYRASQPGLSDAEDEQLLRDMQVLRNEKQTRMTPPED